MSRRFSRRPRPDRSAARAGQSTRISFRRRQRCVRALVVPPLDGRSVGPDRNRRPDPSTTGDADGHAEAKGRPGICPDAADAAPRPLRGTKRGRRRRAGRTRERRQHADGGQASHGRRADGGVLGGKATIVADYRGLTVSDLQAVRRALRGEGITYRVVKNRLARIAAEEVGNTELTPLLEGPTALAMGGGDEVALARTFLDAIRPYKTVVVRGAVLSGSASTRRASPGSRRCRRARCCSRSWPVAWPRRWRPWRALRGTAAQPGLRPVAAAEQKGQQA